MPSYLFAYHADRVVGLRLSLARGGVEAVRFKRSKPMPGSPPSGGFVSDAAVPEAPAVPVAGPFSFTLAVPQENQTGLLGVEVSGWSPINYVFTGAFLLGTQDAFASNGNETNAKPNAPAPGGPVMASRSIDFDFVPTADGIGSELRWRSVSASGKYVFNAANPGYIVALRLSAATSGQLALTTANPWGAAATIGWP